MRAAREASFSVPAMFSSGRSFFALAVTTVAARAFGAEKPMLLTPSVEGDTRMSHRYIQTV